MPASSPAIISQEGKSWKSAVSATYTYDDLDNPNKPSSGLRAQLETELAGLGGDAQYASVEGHAWYFIPFMDEKVVLKLEGNAGHIQSLGNDVPLQDRFFKGADTFRGFAQSGVGPRQSGNDGTTRLHWRPDLCHRHGRGELPARHPRRMGHRRRSVQRLRYGIWTMRSPEAILARRELQVTTLARRSNDCTVFDTMNFRASVGAGIIWTSPFGPLRLSS